MSNEQPPATSAAVAGSVTQSFSANGEVPVTIAPAAESAASAAKTTTSAKANPKDTSDVVVKSELEHVPYKPIGTPKISKVSHNGADFKVVEWEHAGQYLGTILVVHGFCEHSRIYTEFLDKLSQKGFDVVFFDQRGSGETSPGKLYGKTEEVFQMGDIDFFIDKIAKQKPNEKFYLLGHSMGGGLVLNYVIKGKRRNLIKGAVTNAPCIKLHPASAPPSFVTFLAPILNKLIPNFKVDSKLNLNHITGNQKWVDYFNDYGVPLVGTLRLFNDMFERGDALTKPEFVSKWPESTSVLVIHGTGDKINHFDASKKFYSLLPANVTKEFYEVKDGLHSTFIADDETIDSVLAKILEFTTESKK